MHKHRWGQGRDHEGKGYEFSGIETMEGTALRRRAIIAILILRLTGHRPEPYRIHALDAALTDNEIDRICTALGHPRYCPDNKPIPSGECCKENRVATHPVVLPVSALEEGQVGKVLLVRNGDSNRMEYLGGMGILPGVKVKLASASPVIVLRIGNSDVAMGINMAQDLYVLVDYS